MSTRCIGTAALLSCIVSLCPASIAQTPQQGTEQTPEAAAAADATSSARPNEQSDIAFHLRLHRAARHQALAGLAVPTEVIDTLAEGRADVAVATLGRLATAGDRDANIALVRLQHWCSRLLSQGTVDPQPQIEKLGAELPADRAERAAAALRAQAAYRARAAEACRRAQFDYRGIEARLRAAAEGGHPASALELAQFTRDPAQRDAYIQSAVDRNYAPAAYALAANRLAAIQRGATTDNVASIRLLLKQAGQGVSKAKLDLANCMSLGCDGHPADAAGARAFGIDAARDGEAGAFLSMARMPWGRGLSRSQLLAWQYFGDRLNEAGCGGDLYVANATTLIRTIAALEAGRDAQLLEDARERAEALWRDNGTRAMKEQGCAG